MSRGLGDVYKRQSLPGAGAIYDEKQDNQKIFQDAEEWGRTILNYINNEDFSLENYTSKLTTLGKLVEYPEGRGWAKDINADGSLMIETPSGELLNLTSPLISEIK